MHARDAQATEYDFGTSCFDDRAKALAVGADAEQLKALGYSSNFDRTMSKWENFSLGFTYLSPVVGVYSVFALALTAGGPPMWWSYLLVGMGQMLVCLVFGEIVSQFPISGGLYPWAGDWWASVGAWLAGWVYAWALCATISAVATGGAPFIATLIGADLGQGTQTAVAIAMIVSVTALNLSGTRLLGRVAMFGFVCELIGALVVGGYLLLFARHHRWRCCSIPHSSRWTDTIGRIRGFRRRGNVLLLRF